MPLYDYDCTACGSRFELVHGVHAEPPTVCPVCGKGPIRKAISAPTIHYKGSGWAKKERRATASASSSSSSSSTTTEGSSGESGSSETAAASDSQKAEGQSKKAKTTEPATAPTTD